MDFRLSDDQEALRDGIRTFCEGRLPADQLPALQEKGGLDRSLWSELAEMGVFSLRLAESDGGVGLGAADAVIVFAELGRRLVPGPLLWTHLAAPWLPGAATGDAVVGGLDLRGDDRDALVIEHPDGIDALLVLRDDGVFRVDPGDLETRPVATPLDPLTPVHELVTLPRGEAVADAAAAQRARRDGTALAAALQLGIAEATLEMAVAYAKEREQFDRPIGSFQALKHLLADAFTRQELARAAVYAAGATIDQPEVGDPDAAVATAKLIAGEAALRNSRTCIQVQGGMGYTWELPTHYYLKRCWVLENTLGTTAELARRKSGDGVD